MAARRIPAFPPSGRGFPLGNRRRRPLSKTLVPPSVTRVDELSFFEAQGASRAGTAAGLSVR